MNPVEHQQVRDGYWDYERFILMPAFLKTVLGRQLIGRLAERAWANLHRLTDLSVMMASLELEHRISPITNRRELLSAVARVRHADYDPGPGTALVQAVEEERATWHREVSEETKNYHERRKLHRDGPAAIELAMELAAKKLPVGAVANLALMRALVSRPPKAGS